MKFEINHICYLVEDLDEAIAFLEDKGYFMFKEREAAPAFGEEADVYVNVPINAPEIDHIYLFHIVVQIITKDSFNLFPV